ncbi:hypothetical protein ACFXKS_02925 [Streptomyces scopuliridis]|uniref:hypothetical protein n=1 Tax=Streptomyces scopuliridis TaxID=452529 RepID=UPI0036834E02
MTPARVRNFSVREMGRFGAASLSSSSGPWDADVTLVVENGAIAEQGTHDEPLAAEGAYAPPYASRFAALAV